MAEDNIGQIEKEINLLARKNIRNSFEARGGKIKDLTAKLKISSSTIHELLQKEPDPNKMREIHLSTLARIAKGLNFPIDSFFDEKMNFGDYVYAEKKSDNRKSAIDEEIIKASADKFETPIDCMMAVVNFSRFLSTPQKIAIIRHLKAYCN